MKNCENGLTNKSVYGNQMLGDGVNRQEKTFKSHGTEQGRTVGCNEARSSDFVAVQSQPCLRHGPNVSLPTSDDHALRTNRLQLKFFRQRSRYYGGSSAGIHKQLDFFDTPGGARQMCLYVEQSHITILSENPVYCSSDTEQRNSTDQIRMKDWQRDLRIHRQD
jgi:hypothetical protein